MPATPAWPPQSTPRLFIDTPLAAGPLHVDGSAAHYLAGVMRMKIGDPVKLFDDRTGEWLGVASSVGKRDLMLDVTELLRPREDVPDLWLCAAPLKKGRATPSSHGWCRWSRGGRSSTSPIPNACARR